MSHTKTKEAELQKRLDEIAMPEEEWNLVKPCNLEHPEECESCQ